MHILLARILPLLCCAFICAGELKPLPGGGAYALIGPATPKEGVSYDLVICLHGMGDTPDNFARAIASMLPKGRSWVVAAPQGSGTLGGGGRSWVPANDVPLIGATIAEVKTTYKVADGHTYLVAFSAGGVMGWLGLAKNAEQLGGVACLAQVFAPRFLGNPPPPAALTVPVYLGIGTQDPNHRGFARSVEALKALGINVRAEEPAIGHTVNKAEITAAFEHFAAAAKAKAEGKPGAADAEAKRPVDVVP